MRINSTPLIAILAILLLGTLVIPTAYAANVRDTLPVIVAPENSTGGLTPNTLYHYNFVFANSTDCTPLLNISVNITTNSRGVGNTTLNISALGATPTHICEYINGTLRKTHAVFSTMFDNKTADVDITAYGFDKTSTLNTVFLRNTSLPTCAGGQVLTSAGNGVFSCVADAVGSGGNTSWNETRANTLYLLLNDQRYNETTIINTIQNLTYALIAANIGNFSANNNTIWNAINAGNNLTLTQIAANIGNWSSASANYYTTTQVNTLGNWSADKNNYNTTAQLNTLYAPIGTAGDNTSWNETRANTLYATLGQITSIQNLTLAQIANNIGNWTLDKPNYATTTQVNTSWNESRTNSLYATLSQITSIQNLTLAQIATNIGNWSSASANYYTTTQVNTLGNWSAEKANYATTTQVNTIQNLTLAQISTNLGNWSADKPSYATLAQLNAGVGDNVTRTYIANAVGQNLTLTQIATNIGNWSANNATIWTAINDLRTANNTLNTSITTINTQITTIQNLSLTDINTNLGNWSAVQNLICYTNGTGCPPGTSNNSWNQSHADTLYAPISTISYNTSWNQSHANTLYAPIGVTGDNTSWNETRANNLYAPISSGNASWNETRANTLYLGIGATATNSNQLGGQASDYYWNTSTALITTTQALAALGNASAVNTTLNIQTLGFNTTTQLNTLYAPIGTTGDNTSWNETRANNLYTTPAYITGAVGQNLTYNLITTANGNWSAEKASLHNLTLAQIATNIGNWSNVAANYYTATQINTLGNWTLDKNNYNTTAQLNTLYAPIGVTGDNTSWNETRANNLYAPISSGNASWNETRANSLYLQTNDQRYNDTTTITTLQNLTLTQIANNIGNWSSVSANYYTVTQVNTLGNWSADSTNHYTKTYIDTLGNASKLTGSFQCGGTDQLYNITINDSGVYGMCSPQGSGGSGDNSSWNQSHANTLYAPIGTTGDNSSWNETRANTIYLLINDQRYNESGTITTLQNFTLAQIANNIGNWSSVSTDYYTAAQVNTLGNWTLDKPNYATTAQINTSWNETRANTLYAPINSGNASWNETRANSLYATLNQITTLQNLTLNQIATNIGNWSSVATNYYTATQVNTLGNWSADKANLPNLTLAQIANNIGNWSSVSTNYYTKTYIDTLGNASKHIGTCAEGTVIQNITANGIQCITDSTGSGGNASWNQSHANTLYAPLSSGNSSWNETRANSLYATLNQITTIQNLTYAQIANNIGNWTSAATNYYTTTQINTLGNWSAEKASLHNLTLAQIATNIGNWSADKNNYNTTNQLNTLYAPIGSGNSSWNQSHANTLYAPISVTGDNSSWNQSLADSAYYPLASGPTIIRQKNDVTYTSNTGWNSTNFQFALSGGKNYTLNCHILFSGSSTANGQTINVSYSGTATNIILAYDTWSSATAKVGFSATAFGTALVGTGSGATIIKPNFIFADFATTGSGTLQLQIRSELAGNTTTLKRGSTCYLYTDI